MKTHIYTVVSVRRGMAEGARSFLAAGDASAHLARRLRASNPIEDDVQLFEQSLDLSLRTAPRRQSRRPRRRG